MRAHLAHRPAGQRGQPGERRQEDELLPGDAADVVAQGGVEVRPFQGRDHLPQPRRGSAGKLAQRDPLQLAGVRDDAGLRDHRPDVGDAADDVLAAQGARQHLVLVHAVLQGDGDRLSPNDRPQRPGRRLAVPQLDCDHHQIGRARLGRILDDAGRVDERVAQLALDAQAALSDCLRVRAAGDEDDLVSGLREARAVISAHAAAAHHHHFHGHAPCP